MSPARRACRRAKSRVQLLAAGLGLLGLMPLAMRRHQALTAADEASSAVLLVPGGDAKG